MGCAHLFHAWIGSRLQTANDVNVFSLTLNKDGTYHGKLVAYNNTTEPLDA